MSLAIIGDTQLEEFFDKVETKDNYKIAQLNGKNCAFLCSGNGIESNLKIAKEIGIDKVIEITGNDIEENTEKISSNFGIEYSGFLVKGEKYGLKLLLGGIMSGVTSSTVTCLSPREKEVLGLVAHGMSNRDIARTLYLSEKTVKNHLNNIFKKIDVNDRTKAALFALDNNIN